MGISLAELNPYLTLIGVILSLIPIIITYYIYIIKPEGDRKKAEIEEKKKKDEEFIKVFINFLRSIINTLKHRENYLDSLDVNYKYYLETEKNRIKNYYELLHKTYFIYDEISYLYGACVFMLDKVIESNFLKHAPQFSEANKGTISDFYNRTYLLYLNGIKISEEYLKDSELPFYSQYITRIEDDKFALTNILNSNNKFSSENKILIRYRDKKNVLMQLCEELINKIDMDKPS